jgi:hypothetical protein
MLFVAALGAFCKICMGMKPFKLALQLCIFLMLNIKRLNLNVNLLDTDSANPLKPRKQLRKLVFFDP